MKKYIVILFMLLSVPAWATTYYVDATDGDDGEAGTTEGTAWKTISQVNATSFNAGDVIKFKCGETWTDSLTIPTSGSAGNPITFTSYSVGAQPIIDGTGNIYAVDFNEKDYIILKDFELRNGSTATVPIDGDNNVVDSCIIPSPPGNGIKIDGKGCKIKNTVIYNAVGPGILCSTRSEIINCVLYNNDDNYNIWSKVDSVTVRNCIIIDNKDNSPITFTAGSNHVIDHNALWRSDAGDLVTGATPTNTVTAYPAVTDTTVGNYDFSLTAGSPCIDRGYPAMIPYDFLGNAKDTMKPDIGAYEYQTDNYRFIMQGGGVTIK